jgi:hypothetical protein
MFAATSSSHKNIHRVNTTLSSTQVVMCSFFSPNSRAAPVKNTSACTLPLGQFTVQISGSGADTGSNFERLRNDSRNGCVLRRACAQARGNIGEGNEKPAQRALGVIPLPINRSLCMLRAHGGFGAIPLADLLPECLLRR